MGKYARRYWPFIASGSVLLVAAIAIAFAAEPLDGLELHQNFPNPFSSSTEIRYSTPEPGHVLIHVMNAIGVEVQVLVNEAEFTGPHVARFDGSSYPSGHYTYVMEFTSDNDGSKSKLSKRMYLVR